MHNKPNQTRQGRKFQIQKLVKQGYLLGRRPMGHRKPDILKYEKYRATNKIIEDRVADDTNTTRHPVELELRNYSGCGRLDYHRHGRTGLLHHRTLFTKLEGHTLLLHERHKPPHGSLTRDLHTQIRNP